MIGNGEEPHPKSAEVLSHLLSEGGLCDVWREQHPTVRQYTWVKCTESRVSAARLDRLYTSESVRNKVLKSEIQPVGFTDHHLVTFTLSLKDRTRTQTYWKLNVKLLEDVDFCVRFETFWELWRGEKENYDCLSLWWEVGKARIRHFCQQYTAYSSAKIRTAVRGLEKDISKMEDEMVNNKKIGLVQRLKEKKKNLGSILNERAKGALVRARFTSVKRYGCSKLVFFFFIWRKR